jgi:3-hydroxyisobutyrate dehydrogenase
VIPPAKVAVIGLGNMGRPMAARLSKAGYEVAGYDLSAEANRLFRETTGLDPIKDPGEAAAGAAIIITLLPDGKVVHSVLEAIKERLSAGCVVVDMSSSDPIGTRALGESLGAVRISLLDAPISGAVRRATDGSLTIMVGGESTTIERVRPALETLGRLFLTGNLGSGHAAKALNNYLNAAGLIAAVEAVHVARAFGLDLDILTDIFNSSTGRNNTTENKLKQFIISESFDSGFFVGLMAKDVRTAGDLAASLHVPVPLADACSRLWTEAERDLGKTADHTAIGEYIKNLGPKMR